MARLNSLVASVLPCAMPSPGVSCNSLADGVDLASVLGDVLDDEIDGSKLCVGVVVQRKHRPSVDESVSSDTGCTRWSEETLK